MKIGELYDILFGRYGEQHWWPTRSQGRWEIACGAVLTQNCSWSNVEKALANLENRGLTTAEAIRAADRDELAALIRPAGFFRQKSAYLQAVADFFIAGDCEFLKPCGEAELGDRRKRLLAVPGVGRETADAILLYCYNQPIFIIDAYTRRAAERYLGLDPALPYDRLQKLFMDALPRDAQLYQEYHALLVRLGKAWRECKGDPLGILRQ